MILNNILNLAKVITGEACGSGSVVVDATLGNGYDTLFLSNIVGEKGHVYSFDVQKEALGNSLKRLEAENAVNNYTLIHDGHQNMAKYIRPEHQGKVAAVMFNLGYLPGSDKSVVTRSETTMQAVNAALDLLAPGGVIAIAVYTGQAGGIAEEEAVRSYCLGLDFHKVHTLEACILNKPGYPIRLFCIAKI